MSSRGMWRIAAKYAAGGFVCAATVMQWRWVAFFDDRQCQRDNLGGYPETYYSESGTREPSCNLRPPLCTHHVQQHKSSQGCSTGVAGGHEDDDESGMVNVCVIGGGFAGLHCALSLAERGQSVMLLESRRIGSGASGRNGGDALVGFHIGNEELAALVGDEKAKVLYKQSVELGYERLKKLIKKHRIQCDSKECGAVTLSFRGNIMNVADDDVKAAAGGGPDDASLIAAAAEKELLSGLHADVKHLNANFDEHLKVIDNDELQKKAGITAPHRYVAGVFNPRNLSLNPLELVLGLARACESTGMVRIHEMSPVIQVVRRTTTGPTPTGRAPKGSSDVVVKKKRVRREETFWDVRTEMGSVRANHVVLATNGAPGILAPRLALWTTPISTAMILTKQLPRDLLDKVLTAKCAIFDDRFALAYFRRVDGDRILFGGLASGTPMRREHIEQELTRDLCAVFPSLEPFLYKTSNPSSSSLMNSLRPTPSDSQDASIQSTMKLDDSAKKNTQDEVVSARPLRDCPDPAMSWQGRIEASWPIFPHVGRIGSDSKSAKWDGLWYSLGFAGHGLVPTCAAGELIAAAIVSIPSCAERSQDDDQQPLPTDNRLKLWGEVHSAWLRGLGGMLPQGGPWGLLWCSATCKLLNLRDRKRDGKV